MRSSALLALVLASCGGPRQDARTRDAEEFPGGDLGARINAASAALGEGPAVIRVSTQGTVTTPVRLHAEHALQFGPGTWRFAAAPGITVDDACEVSGAGVHRTRLVLADGVEGDLVRSVDFEALSDVPEKQIQARRTRRPDLEGFDGGVKFVTIRDLTLRGNRLTTPGAHGAGVRLFGSWWTLRDLSIEQFGGDGLFTEWIAAADVLPEGNDAPEGWLTHVKILSNGGNGWTMRGPHDSVATAVMVANNLGVGIDVQHREGYHSGGGVIFQGVHAYGNRSDGVRTAPGANILAFGLESEGNHGSGLVLRSNDCMVTGEFYANSRHGVQIGEGEAYSGANTLVLQSHNNGGAQIAWEKSAGGNRVSAALHATGAQKYQLNRPTRFDSMSSAVGGLGGNDLATFVPGGIVGDVDGMLYGVRAIQFRDRPALLDSEGRPRP